MADKLLQYMIQKNAKELADSMKVKILDRLIELSETKNHGEMVLKVELEIIREGVEKARNKEKDKEIKALTSVIDNLIGRFGKEKDFDDKVEKKLKDETTKKKRFKGKSKTSFRRDKN